MDEEDYAVERETEIVFIARRKDPTQDLTGRFGNQHRNAAAIEPGKPSEPWKAKDRGMIDLGAAAIVRVRLPPALGGILP